MLRLKGQTESGEWVEFYPVDIVDTFEDEIKILLDKEIWVYADTIQPADDKCECPFCGKSWKPFKVELDMEAKL